ncbi:hypothetical protein MRB53_000542 [Persea americana]|uniref:Uncharacterized protein n=1 Tax=Persea americana TaxID=3435 RepID=A0ACC2MQ65_PERAE|nr:hypothetical protein MRB53_000542 [Persea americana]
MRIWIGFKTSCPDYNHVGSWERLKPVTARPLGTHHRLSEHSITALCSFPSSLLGLLVLHHQIQISPKAHSFWVLLLAGFCGCYNPCWNLCKGALWNFFIQRRLATWQCRITAHSDQLIHCNGADGSSEKREAGKRNCIQTYKDRRGEAVFSLGLHFTPGL